MSALARYDIDALAEQIFKESIVVINQEKAGFRVLPTVKVDCPKYDGNRANYRTIYASDDEETMTEV